MPEPAPRQIRRATEAGFDVLDIHAAHGNPFHAFLSPINNDRTDSYGGDFAGRTRSASIGIEWFNRFFLLMR